MRPTELALPLPFSWSPDRSRFTLMFSGLSKGFCFLFCPSAVFAFLSPHLILLQETLPNYSDVGLIVSKDYFFLAVFSASPLYPKSTATSGELLHLFHLMQENSPFNCRQHAAPEALAAWFVWLAVLPAQSARALVSEWMFLEIFHQQYKF